MGSRPAVHLQRDVGSKLSRPVHVQHTVAMLGCGTIPQPATAVWLWRNVFPEALLHGALHHSIPGIAPITGALSYNQLWFADETIRPCCASVSIKASA